MSKLTVKKKEQIKQEKHQTTKQEQNKEVSIPRLTCEYLEQTLQIA